MADLKDSLKNMYLYASGGLTNVVGHLANGLGYQDHAEQLWEAGAQLRQQGLGREGEGHYLAYDENNYGISPVKKGDARKAALADAQLKLNQANVKNAKVADEVETGLVTLIQTGTAIDGGIIGSKVPIIGTTFGAVGGWQGGEALTDWYLSSNGDMVPARSLRRAYGPVGPNDSNGPVIDMLVDTVGLRHDPQYAAGTSMLDYNLQQAPAQPALGRTAAQPAPTGDGQTGGLGDIGSWFKSLKFGGGSLVGIGIGIVTLLAGAPAWAGALVLAGGAIFGQNLLEMAKPSAAAPVAAAPAPTTNHPRSEAPAASPDIVVPPVVGPAPAKEPQAGVVK